MFTLKTFFPAGKSPAKEAGILLLILAALLGLWFVSAAAHRRTAMAEIARNLTAVNSYKAAQMAAWLDAHGREAARLSRHPFMGGIIQEEIAAPGSRRAQLISWSKDYIKKERYSAMAFLSVKNAVIAATPGYSPGTEKSFLEAFAKAAQGAPLLTDLYLAADGRPRLAMLSPLFAGGRSGGKPVCVLVTDIDPDAEFYPLLKALPLLVPTAETLLVRKEGEYALYLNELENRKGSALKLTLPLSDTHLPAVAALSGRTGFFEGTDYRGVKVFSAIAHLKSPEWAVVTKIDRDALLAPVTTTEYFRLAVLLLAAGLAWAGFLAVSAARKKAVDSALRSTRQLLDEAEKAGRIGGWEIDTKTLAQTWTDEMFRILEMDLGKGAPQVPQGMNILAPASREKADLAVRRAMEAGEPYDQEWEIITAKGNRRWVHAVARIQREQGKVRGSFQDITDRKLAEEKLRESETRYRALFGNMLNGLAYCRMIYEGDRPADFVYLEVNQAFEKLTGLRNVTGKKVTELIPGARESDSALFEIYGRVARGGPPETFELRLEALKMWLHISVYSPARDCFVAIFEVITERKLAELERDRLNRELAAKKEDMENFLHITTHDLRGPLINIQGFSQELNNYYKELQETAAPASLPGEPKSRTSELMRESIPQALRIIESSAIRMGEMLNVLLKMSRLGRMPLRSEPVDMDATLKLVLTSLSYQLERAGGAVTAGPLPPCTGDPGIVGQLFSNLLDNAIKYRNRDRKLEITVSGERKDEKTALYTVSDNGLGIKEADLARIWRLFYRGHARQPGVEKGEGIGLTMIKRMVERSGGSIRVESKEGAGTKFFVELPA